MVGGYPVEYRVFVLPANPHSGRLGFAVSSYYPQRPLPDDKGTQREVEQAIAYTQRLTRTRLWPYGATVDYLATPEGDVLLLEGGPPWLPREEARRAFGLAAHPCCFGDDPIEDGAVALVDRAPKRETGPDILALMAAARDGEDEED